jgi:hypothetical protein
MLETAVIALGMAGAIGYGFAISSLISLWLGLVAMQTGRKYQKEINWLAPVILWIVLVCGVLCVLMSSAWQVNLSVYADRAYWLTCPTLAGVIYAQIKLRKESTDNR